MYCQQHDRVELTICAGVLGTHLPLECAIFGVTPFTERSRINNTTVSVYEANTNLRKAGHETYQLIITPEATAEGGFLMACVSQYQQEGCRHPWFSHDVQSCRTVLKPYRPATYSMLWCKIRRISAAVDRLPKDGGKIMGTSGRLKFRGETETHDH